MRLWEKTRQQKYDAIIIGAGLGGLTCGAILAKSGLRTLIIEKHSIPGGYCTSFKRKGFIFDSAVHFTEGLGHWTSPGGGTLTVALSGRNIAKVIIGAHLGKA